METYAFLPREAVTAFLMGCPQCSTNNSVGSAVTVSTSDDGAQQLATNSTAAATTPDICRGVSVEQWSSSSVAFACSTPVKCDAETGNTKDLNGTVVVVESVLGADKENVERQTTALTAKICKVSNKRKRTVPLKIGVRQPCQVIPVTSTVVSDNTSTSSSTLKNSSSSSCTLVLSSPSSSSLLSSRTDNSVISRSSEYWWSKWGQQGDNNRSVSGISGNLGSTCTTGNMQPLDLSSSPTPTTIRSSSSPVEDFFYKRRCIRRRRVRSKRLNRSRLGRGRGDHHEDDNDTSVSDCTGGSENVIDDVRGHSVNGSMEEEKIAGKRPKVRNETVGHLETDEEDDCPRPPKIKKALAGKLGDRRNNNNDDDYYDKVTAVVAARRTSMVAINCCTSDSDQIVTEDMEMTDMPTAITTMKRTQGAFIESDLEGQDVTDNNQVSHYRKNYIISHNLLSMTIFDIMDGSCNYLLTLLY